MSEFREDPDAGAGDIEYVEPEVSTDVDVDTGDSGE